MQVRASTANPRRGIRAWKTLAPIIVLAGAASACGVLPRPTVDGIPVGGRAGCDAGACNREIAFARSWLDAKAPGHAPVRQVEIRLPDYRTPNGDQILLTRSSGRTVVAVLRLEDGSTRAVLMGCGVGVHPDECGVFDPPADAA
ncbi:MAG TPA: hypothetical protein VH440_01160 [Candidatus Limnocylindrales bacterium]|jgi:hypothetical protein